MKLPRLPIDVPYKYLTITSGPSRTGSFVSFYNRVTEKLMSYQLLPELVTAIECSPTVPLAYIQTPTTVCVICLVTFECTVKRKLNGRVFWRGAELIDDNFNLVGNFGSGHGGSHWLD